MLVFQHELTYLTPRTNRKTEAYSICEKYRNTNTQQTAHQPFIFRDLSRWTLMLHGTHPEFPSSLVLQDGHLMHFAHLGKKTWTPWVRAKENAQHRFQNPSFTKKKGHQSPSNRSTVRPCPDFVLTVPGGPPLDQHHVFVSKPSGIVLVTMRLEALDEPSMLLGEIVVHQISHGPGVDVSRLGEKRPMRFGSQRRGHPEGESCEWNVGPNVTETS